LKISNLSSYKAIEKMKLFPMYVVLGMISACFMVVGAFGASPEISPSKTVSRYNPSKKFYEPVKCGPGGGEYTCYKLHLRWVPVAQKSELQPQ
jgi:hypothetical protein